MAIASTYDGEMYGMGTGGGLYKINTETGSLTLVGNTGYMPWFLQSMEFDHTDNTLYWAGSDAEHTFLAAVDVNTAAAIEIGDFTCHSHVQNAAHRASPPISRLRQDSVANSTPLSNGQIRKSTRSAQS